MAEELNTSQLQKDDSASIPRTKISEIGYTGIRTVNGAILEEADRRLRYPAFIKEVDEMLKDSVIGTGVQFTRTMLNRVEWFVKAPLGATAQQLERAKFIETCMNDMEHSWGQFIQELTYYIPYGFSVHEKVFRRRLKTAGSKYNDGLAGWRKLPVRSQSTITKWEFSDDGRELLGLEQTTANLVNMANAYTSASGGSYRKLPREKFLLFTADNRVGNPEGNSPLKSVWVTWRQRRMMEEQESIAVARDLGGIPVAKIPTKFMSEDANASDKAVYSGIKKMVANLHQNSQAGIVLPSDVDENSKQPYFDFKLLSSEGGKGIDTGAIIQRLNDAILVALGADVLTMGVNKTGSFSLSGAKTSLSAMMLEARLKEIRDVLNNDLIKHTFELNGWTDTELPTFEYREFDELEPDETSKAFQRLGSIGFLVKDVETVNAGRKLLGVPMLPPDTKIEDLEFSNDTSRSGDGMAKGTGNGTSDQAASQDNSVGNMENA